MSLSATPVAKCLDKKLLILGFEIPDVLAIFLLLSILNFLFGQTHYKLFLIWLPVVLLAVGLHFGKKGKPDQFLIHWIRFYFRPGYFSAFRESEKWKEPPSRFVMGRSV